MRTIYTARFVNGLSVNGTQEAVGRVCMTSMKPYARIVDKYLIWKKPNRKHLRNGAGGYSKNEP